MEAKHPATCRLCDVPLGSADEWRQHAKSSWHVYNLRKSVAEPGTSIKPPSPSPRPKKVSDGQSEAPSEGDSDSNDSDMQTPTELELNPAKCLFCDAKHDSFDETLKHMLKAHGFTIPEQDHLIVGLEVLISHFYEAIYGYGECMLCSARRSTVEGIQQHMAAKGHCRFEISPDTEDFYDLPKREYHAVEDSLRLPSGKVLSHRTRSSRTAASRAPHQSLNRHLQTVTAATSAQEAQPGSSSENTQALIEASSTQLSRLSKGDQQSLAHLPDHQVRSLLANSARQIDRSRREETQARLRLEEAGNETLFGHFRMDTSKRYRGPWG